MMPGPDELMQMVMAGGGGPTGDNQEQMLRFLMGPLGGMMAGGMPEGIPGGTGMPGGMMGMDAGGIAEMLGDDELPPGQSKPAPDPEEQIRFSQMMKMMAMMGAMQGGGMGRGMGPGGGMGMGPGGPPMMPSHVPGSMPNPEDY